MAEERENNEEFENSQSSQLEEEHLQKVHVLIPYQKTPKNRPLGV